MLAKCLERLRITFLGKLNIHPFCIWKCLLDKATFLSACWHMELVLMATNGTAYENKFDWIGSWSWYLNGWFPTGKMLSNHLSTTVLWRQLTFVKYFLWDSINSVLHLFYFFQIVDNIVNLLPGFFFLVHHHDNNGLLYYFLYTLL